MDRSLYILLYASFGAVTVIVIQLDLSFSGAGLKLVNVAYLWLLGVVGLGVFLIADFRRHASFLRRLESIGADESLDRLGFLSEPKTLDQRVFADAWARLYARLRAELVEERSRGRENVHLVSRWAHQMKSPVSVIDLELQKAHNMEIPPELAEVLSSIEEENQRLNGSIQMLLNMVRLEDFATDFAPERVNLLSLVRRLVNENRRMFIAYGVFPKILGGDEVETSWPFVVSDSKWLRFALQQVISNAIKYSSRPEKDGEVCISCRRGDVDGEVVLEIADNGIGIAPEDLGRVFAPFYTGSSGRAYPRSTGMGLYLANQACERLGHRISVESSPGKGTRVYVRFSPDPTIFAGVDTSLAQR